MTKFCIFTSTRADYGILSPLVRLIQADADFEMRLFVTGTHLLAEHGYTIEEIKKDNLRAFYQVPLAMTDKKDVYHLETMGTALTSFSVALAQNMPDVALVLGDRFEALSFALAANGLGIPLIHLHGGEVTEGALDEAYRHCITKLSYLHFTAAETYRQRVIRMGESPDRVFNVGALGVDNIKSIQMLSKEELSRDLNISFKEKIIAVTYHPETSNPERDENQIKSLLSTLQKEVEDGKTSLVFTRANADHGNEAVHRHIENFVSMNSNSCVYVHSLGMKRYLSLLNLASVVVGNSSSGIIEAPALGTPTVNIGDRQKGREMAQSIFNVHDDENGIMEGLKKALLFKAQHKGKNFSIYGDGTAAPKIMKVLKKWRFQRYPLKSFFDLSESKDQV